MEDNGGYLMEGFLTVCGDTVKQGSAPKLLGG